MFADEGGTARGIYMPGLYAVCSFKASSQKEKALIIVHIVWPYTCRRAVHPLHLCTISDFAFRYGYVSNTNITNSNVSRQLHIAREITWNWLSPNSR